MPDDDLYEQIIDAAHGVYGKHPGHRALHAKGTWCEGEFTATPEAARLSRAAPLQGEPIPALVRFSNAVGDPESNDATRDGRGIAVKLRAEGGEWDILATTAPAFVTKTPEDFLELMRLRRPDPATGEPDMEKLGGFLAAHPEMQTAAQSILMAEPNASFATAIYHSPHAFYLLDADGEKTAARWSLRPEAGEERIPDDEARERGRDYLREELTERLRGGSVGFELVFQLAGPDDPLEDSTAVWPDDRETVSAGRLVVNGIVDDPESGGHIEVFDPCRIVDGIELSDDPILLARPHAYSVSAYARLDARA